MALTNKALSTISYNSIEFLKDKLDRLVASEAIAFYAFIRHKGENGDKDHIHLYLEPNKRLETMKLQKEFNEATPLSDKPLGVMRFQRSKIDDWTMYSLHDESYLKLKNEEREEHYSIDDVISSDIEVIKQTIDDWNSVPHFANKNQEIAHYLTIYNMSTYQVAMATGYKVLEIEAIRKAKINEEVNEDKHQYQEQIKATIEEKRSNGEKNVVIQTPGEVQEGKLPTGKYVKVSYIDMNGEVKEKVMLMDSNGNFVAPPKPIENEEDDLPF